MKLSAHFSLHEAVKSSTAERFDIDNTPDDAEIEKLKLVAVHILEPPRNHFAIMFAPSSFYRCVELCEKLGSKSTSQHAQAEAVDFEIPTINNITLVHWMEDNVDFDKLILEFYRKGISNSGWIHASYRLGENRHKTYTISRENGVVLTKVGLPT